jgi:hypothetical protein
MVIAGSIVVIPILLALIKWTSLGIFLHSVTSPFWRLVISSIITLIIMVTGWFTVFSLPYLFGNRLRSKKKLRNVKPAP